MSGIIYFEGVQMLAWLSLSIATAANPFRVEIQSVSMTVDETTEMLVTFMVPEGYHLYHDMMSVEPKTKENLTFSPPVFPIGHLIVDPANPEQMREVFDTVVQVKVPVTSSASGVYMTDVKVRYQGCKKTLCYMPKSETLPVTIQVGERLPEATEK
jgi:thiol:disulfide interchange protein